MNKIKRFLAAALITGTAAMTPLSAEAFWGWGPWSGPWGGGPWGSPYYGYGYPYYGGYGYPHYGYGYGYPHYGYGYPYYGYTQAPAATSSE